MAEASVDRGNLARSLIIWAIALVAGILVIWIVGGLFGFGTTAGLIFGAIVFLVLPYLLPAGRSAGPHAPAAALHGQATAEPAAHAPTTPPPHDHPASTLDQRAAPLANLPGIAPEATPGPVHADAVPAAPGGAFSERVREAARAAGEAARGLGADGAPAASKPATLAAARDGAPDDLKRIKGIGPRIEAQLHELGIYHFDQIAGWGAAELAWIDANLEGFSGRAAREDWVGQSRILAAGGDTEHSLEVDRGAST